MQYYIYILLAKKALIFFATAQYRILSLFKLVKQRLYGSRLLVNDYFNCILLTLFIGLASCSGGSSGGSSNQNQNTPGAIGNIQLSLQVPHEFEAGGNYNIQLLTSEINNTNYTNLTHLHNIGIVFKDCESLNIINPANQPCPNGSCTIQLGSILAGESMGLELNIPASNLASNSCTLQAVNLDSQDSLVVNSISYSVPIVLAPNIGYIVWINDGGAPNNWKLSMGYPVINFNNQKSQFTSWSQVESFMVPTTGTYALNWSFAGYSVNPNQVLVSANNSNITLNYTIESQPYTVTINDGVQPSDWQSNYGYPTITFNNQSHIFKSWQESFAFNVNNSGTYNLLTNFANYVTSPTQIIVSGLNTNQTLNYIPLTNNYTVTISDGPMPSGYTGSQYPTVSFLNQNLLFTDWNQTKTVKFSAKAGIYVLNTILTNYSFTPSTITLPNNGGQLVINLLATSTKYIMPGWPVGKISMGSFINPAPISPQDSIIESLNQRPAHDVFLYSSNNSTPWKAVSTPFQNLAGLIDGVARGTKNLTIPVLVFYSTNLSGAQDYGLNTLYNYVIDDNGSGASGAPGMQNTFEREIIDVAFAEYFYQHNPYLQPYPPVFILSPDYLGTLQQWFASGTPLNNGSFVAKDIPAQGYTEQNILSWANLNNTGSYKIPTINIGQILESAINALYRDPNFNRVCLPTQLKYNNNIAASACPTGAGLSIVNNLQTVIANIPSSFYTNQSIATYNLAVAWIVGEFGNGDIPYGWEDADWAGTNAANGWIENPNSYGGPNINENIQNTSEFLSTLGINQPQSITTITGKQIITKPSFIAFDKNGINPIENGLVNSTSIYDYNAWQTYVAFTTGVGNNLGLPIMFWQIPGAHLPLNANNPYSFMKSPYNQFNTYQNAATAPLYVFGFNKDNLYQANMPDNITQNFAAIINQINNGQWNNNLQNLVSKNVFAILWGANAATSFLPQNNQGDFDDLGWLYNQVNLAQNNPATAQFITTIAANPYLTPPKCVTYSQLVDAATNGAYINSEPVYFESSISTKTADFSQGMEIIIASDNSSNNYVYQCNPPSIGSAGFSWCGQVAYLPPPNNNGSEAWKSAWVPYSYYTNNGCH